MDLSPTLDPLLAHHPPAMRERLIHAWKILEAGLSAVDPYAAVLARLEVHPSGDSIRAAGRTFELPTGAKVSVIGAGKAAAPMAKAVLDVLGDRIGSGAVTVKYGHQLEEDLGPIAQAQAGHPIVDQAGLDGTARILECVRGGRPRDLVIGLISGGGSALLESPSDGIGLPDLQRLSEQLIRSGAPIEEINAVRKHVSKVKGGQLARALAPARAAGLILSDVIGSPLDAIASGPLSPDPTTFASALGSLDKWGLRSQVPPAVLHHLGEGLAGRRAETPKAGDPIFDPVHTEVIADNRIACLAAVAKASQLGRSPLLLSSELEGEAREAAKLIAQVARQVRARGERAAVIWGGETTVTVRGKGKGGRNQELALAAAIALSEANDVLILTLATDGTDGPTDAAGAVATPKTVERARKAGLDPVAFLNDNDAYSFFQALGDLVVTGPTRTNVCDLGVAIIG